MKQFIFQLPPTASFKMLNDKCREFGDVQNIEDKGNGTVVVTFANEWDAERAISILLTRFNVNPINTAYTFEIFSLTFCRKFGSSSRRWAHHKREDILLRWKRLG